ncbi:MAG TPA: pentapeptide repeat-containing protein, partial [Tepidisphaeraceae bacterium]
YLSHWSFLEVLEYVGSFSILIAVILYFTESGERRQQKHYQAWQVINTAQGKGGSGGRVDALQQLNKDHVPLVGVDVSMAFLQNVALEGAELRRAMFRDADIRNARLRNAVLADADLTSANLRESDLRGADLSGATLTDSDLALADFRGANFANVSLDKADLSSTSPSFTSVRRPPGYCVINSANENSANAAAISSELISPSRRISLSCSAVSRDCGVFEPDGQCGSCGTGSPRISSAGRSVLSQLRQSSSHWRDFALAFSMASASVPSKYQSLSTSLDLRIDHTRPMVQIQRPLA